MIVPPRIKICCISSIAEAVLAVQLGASAIGLVSDMPSGPGVIADELIGEITATVPPPVATFLLTSRCDAEGIAEQHRNRTSAIQLVDRVAPDELKKVRRLLPSVKIIQVIHVMGESSVDEANEVSRLVDALLLDSGNPNLGVKELGGTGRVHDWRISRLIRDNVQCPLFLAGGLRSTNVAAAIEAVQPFGLDVCSSVRHDGRLNRQKLAEFIQAVRSAGQRPDTEDR